MPKHPYILIAHWPNRKPGVLSYRSKQARGNQAAALTRMGVRYEYAEQLQLIAPTPENPQAPKGPGNEIPF